MNLVNLGLIIHRERQQEIERTLEHRRLLAELKEQRIQAAAAPERRVPQRQERAGAAR